LPLICCPRRYMSHHNETFVEEHDKKSDPKNHS